MDNEPKKRGRKKLPVVNVTQDTAENIPEKKKRGRKKKWETSTFKTNYPEQQTDHIYFERKDVENDDSYKTGNFSFLDKFLIFLIKRVI